MLFLARMLFENYSSKIELEYLFKSFVKLALLGFVAIFSIKNKLFSTPLFKNTIIFLLIALVSFYFAYTNTQQIIKAEHVKVNALLPLSFLFSCFVTGMFEETFFRVLFFNAFVQSFSVINTKTIFKSYLLTSLVFGLIHFVNLNSAAFFGVFNQVLLAFGFGILMQVLLAKYNSLLFVAFLHAMFNFFGTRSAFIFGFKNSATTLVKDSNYDVFLNLSVFVFIDVLIIIYVYFFVKGIDLNA